MEKKRTMKKRWVLDQTLRHTIEETWAVFTKGTETPNPALFLARLADLARSNTFLWAEAGLQVQERTTRMVPVGQSLSRSLVLATVAADIFVGYTSLRERATWLSSLVQPRDWQLQHQRSANRVLETAASLGGVLIKACQSASTRRLRPDRAGTGRRRLDRPGASCAAARRAPGCRQGAVPGHHQPGGDGPGGAGADRQGDCAACTRDPAPADRRLSARDAAA